MFQPETEVVGVEHEWLHVIYIAASGLLAYLLAELRWYQMQRRRERRERLRERLNEITKKNAK